MEIEFSLKLIVEQGVIVRIEVVQPTGQNNPVQCVVNVKSMQLITRQENRVWTMLAQGNSVKEIATKLGLSVKTVEVHKWNLMRKLDVHCRADLTLAAIKNKVIEIV